MKEIVVTRWLVGLLRFSSWISSVLSISSWI